VYGLKEFSDFEGYAQKTIGFFKGHLSGIRNGKSRTKIGMEK